MLQKLVTRLIRKYAEMIVQDKESKESLRRVEQLLGHV
jgi:hypothetical protein